MRCSQYDSNSHFMLGRKSAGIQLSAGMRLVGLCLLQWVEEAGFVSVTPAFIEDRTSIPADHVDAILTKLESVGLASCYADGWQLTIDKYKNGAMLQWLGRKQRGPTT